MVKYGTWLILFMYCEGLVATVIQKSVIDLLINVARD